MTNARVWVPAMFAVLAGCANAPRESAETSCEMPEAARTHVRAAELDALVADVVAHWRLPGAIFAVRDPNGVYVGAAGSADLEFGVSMMPCHRTRIASVTKSFVAVVVMRLVERGVLALEAPIASLLPDEDLRGIPNHDAVIVRDLLANRSGIPDYVDLDYVLDGLNDPGHRRSAAEVLDRVRGRSADFEAGSRFRYSNTNWLLLERIVERATGRSFAEVLAAEVLEPLGLTRTSYRRDDFGTAGIVRGYFDVYGSGVVIDTTDDLALDSVAADGGVVSDALGLLRFFDGLVAQRAVVSADSFAAMTRWSDPSSDPEWSLEEFTGYGLGLIRWELDGVEGIGHGGDLFGYQAHAYSFAERDTSFVLLVNGSSFAKAGDNLTARVDAARDELARAILAP